MRLQHLEGVQVALPFPHSRGQGILSPWEAQRRGERTWKLVHTQRPPGSLFAHQIAASASPAL